MGRSRSPVVCFSLNSSQKIRTQLIALKDTISTGDLGFPIVKGSIHKFVNLICMNYRIIPNTQWEHRQN